ncbi:MAG: cytochrome b/b6 domain-containing protein [Ignavibacteria bacterium]|nr:cytochrome b/b6 domain-containing protein [Ignavibacteria bacterium]
MKSAVNMVLSGYWTLVVFFPFFSAQAQSSEDCLTCHSEKSLTTEKRGKEISLYVEGKVLERSAHGDLECILCHEGYDPNAIPHTPRAKTVDCSSCHAGELTDAYEGSIHRGTGNVAAASCVDCHSYHAVQRISEQDSVRHQQMADAMCATCHGDIHKEYSLSGHGRAVANGIAVAPSCVDCHGAHGVLPALDERAQTSRKKEIALCLACHQDKPEVRAIIGPSAGFISSYESSVHGQASNDRVGAAVCTDCHGSHAIIKGSEPSSAVGKLNVASTCGECHQDINEQFSGSIHGWALTKGVMASPTCTDCHGEHNILSPKDPRSPVAPANVSAQVCSPCHASVKLTAKYGLASDRFQSFEDSFHGLATRAGSVEVANCASCHGVHDIKPSSDPASRISPENIVKTCGKCHPGANQNFARGSVHVVTKPGQENIISFVAGAYVLLIVVTIGGMFLHNIIDFYRKSKRKLMRRRGLLAQHHVSHRLYLRMSLNERFQHGTLLISFMTLVVTGFMLKFPDAWWVVTLRNLSPLVFDLRGIVHRVAGVVLIVASLYHIYYVLVVPRGKQLLRDLLPVRQDLRDMVNVVRFNLGLRSEKPLLGRFSYIEKSEYWALVWGTAVMGATGIILWFDNTFLGLLTKLWWDVSRTVHYYEAWLATLAIIVWHFYFVIFNPDSYPMNLAWWKGTLTEEEMEEEHPLELQKIHEQEKMIEEAEEVERSTLVERGEPERSAT